MRTAQERNWATVIDYLKLPLVCGMIVQPAQEDRHHVKPGLGHEKQGQDERVCLPVGLRPQHAALHPPLQPSDEGEAEVQRLHGEAGSRVWTNEIHCQV